MVWPEWDPNPASAGRILVCPYQGHWWHVWQKNGCQVIIFFTLVSGCRQSKVWIKRPCLKLARFLRSLPRTKLGVLIGLLTGHVRLNKHLHRMGLLSYPACAACGIEEESALHFICVCPTLAILRTQIFGKPIRSVSEYEGMSAGSFVQFAEKSGRFETRVQWNLNYGVHIRHN
jgi:hypothetical protein